MLLVLVFGLVAPVTAQASTGGTRLTMERIDNDSVAFPLEKMPEQASRQPEGNVRVSIVLDAPSTMEAGFSTKGIGANDQAMIYRADLEQEQLSLQTSIETQVLHAPLDVVWNLTLAANIISANVPAAAIADIEALPGVDHVAVEMQYQPHVASKGGDYAPNMAVSGQMTGAAQAWEEGYTGAGTRIAVVDTGLDTDHQSFDARAYRHAIREDALEAGMTYEAFLRSANFMGTADTDAVLRQLNSYKRQAAAGRELTSRDLYVNDKAPYGYNYLDGSFDVTHDHDDQGEHGSHVAGITSANRYLVQDGEFLNALEQVHVTGAAPDAQLMIMKVFGKKGGAYDSDIMAAIEDAVILGADSVNLSLGSASAGTAICPDATYEKIMQRLVDSDTVVVISAGNSGSWGDNTPYGYLYTDGVNLDTVGSPGSYTNALTVASVDNDGTISPTLTVEGRSMGYYESLANFIGTPFGNTALAELDTSADGSGTAYDYVLLDGVGLPEDFAGIDVTGKLVFLSRGELTYTEKAENAAAAGAAALIVYNHEEKGTVLMDLSGYTQTMPAVFITKGSGSYIRSVSIPQTTEAGGTYYTGSASISRRTAGHYDASACKSMSVFSSWGVPGDLSLKPEVTAPGGNIYSVNGAVPETDQYELMSGTSMAAPQIAGQTALVQQYVLEQGYQAQGLTSRGLSQALLMSTAVPMRCGDNNLYYSVLNQGAGLTNVHAALRTPVYLTIDGMPDGKVKVELGDDPQRTGTYQFSFTLHNLSREELSYVLSGDIMTQNIITTDSGVLLMDKLTRLMEADVVFSVDGRVLAAGESIADCDFDGDGRISLADAQALSDFVLLGKPLVAAADRADLSGDGKVNTYDVHCFLERYQGAVTVPAQGQTTVSVTFTLTDAEKARLEQENPKGAYVEAYFHAAPMATAEGEQLPVLGIPVLGYFGNWTDPDMFDLGSHETYACGAETRTPYLGSVDANALGIVLGDRQMDGVYYFGGNPVVPDEVFMPERNAINLERGDYFPAWQFSPIRNAAASWFTAVNETTGEVLASMPAGEHSAAFYVPQYQDWMGTPTALELELRPDMEEGERGRLSLTLVPEAYVESDGSFDWEKLGEGATREVPFVVDNHDPVIHDVRILHDEGVIEVDASDNQFVAGIYLYDVTGRYRLSMVGSAADAAENDGVRTYRLPLEGVDGYKFILQVFDYASNMATYRIKEIIGEPEPRPDQILFDENSHKWIRVDKSTNEYYTWETKEWSATEVLPLAATSVGSYSFIASDGGKLFVTPSDSMMDTVFIRKLPALVHDLTYDKASDLLYAVTADSELYSIDKLDGRMEDLGRIGAPTNTLAGDGNGTFYCADNDGRIYSFTLDTLAEPTVLCQVEKDPYDTYLGVHTMEVDPATGHIVWIARNDNGYGYESSVYFSIDPATGTIEKKPSPVYRGAIGLSYPDWTDGIDQWAEPCSQPTQVTFDASAVEVFSGYTARVHASALPWTLSDRSVVYSSSDESVATVDADGVVTGVTTGTAVIRAASTLDPSVYSECSVEVKVLDVTVNGLLQDAEGVPQSFSWNMADGSSWESGYKLDTFIKSVANIPGEDAYYMMSSSEGTMHKRSIATGEDLVEPSTVYWDDNYWILDMSYSNYFSEKDGAPRIYGVRENSILAPTDPMKPDYVHLRASMARFLPGIAVGGTETISYKDWYNEIETESEIFYMVDDAGNVWRCNMFLKDSWGTMVYDWTFTVYRSDLNVSFQGPDFQGNCSLVLGEDGALYLSAFTGKQSELYRLVFDPANGRYVSTYLGGFGKDVWPAALLTVESNVPAVPQAPAGTHLASAEFAEEENKPAAPAVQGGLMNAAAFTAAPAIDRQPVLQLTAPAGRTNGLVEITFDPAVMTLKTVQGQAQIVSYDIGEGVARIGYAWANAASEDAAYASLLFEGKDACTGDVTITELEQNELETAQQRTVTLDLNHAWGDWTVTQEPTCTQEGQEIRTCTHCGKTETRSVPALGHAWGEWIVTKKPTSTEEGQQTRTCQRCGETQVRSIPMLEALPFTDVSEQQWYAEAVRYVYEHDLMNGVTDTLFAPYEPVTRGQMVTVLYRMAGAPEVQRTHAFTDVAENAYYADAVAWGYAEGIIQGISADRFAPGLTVTREQMITFLYRYCNGAAEDASVLEGYPDSDAVAPFARDAMIWAVENGLLKGIPTDGILMLQPKADSSRAQFAALITRIEVR